MSPQISKLTARIREADLTDLHEQAAIRDELVELRDLLLRISRPDMAGCLEAAVTLTRHIPQIGIQAAEEVRGVVLRLIGLVGEALPQPSEGETSGGTRKLKLVPRQDGDETGLRLINDMLLGEILLQLGTLSREKVDAALKAQQATGMRFGEALVHMGAASWEEVQRALDLQSQLSDATRMATEGPSKTRMSRAREGPPIQAFGSKHLNVLNDMMLGEEMIRMGVITRDQLEQALRVQNAAGIRIGEALVEIGAATWDQVAEGVRMQGKHREHRPGGPQGRPPIAL